MLLGIDLGTSSVKAALVDEGGAEVASAAIPYPTVRNGDAEEQDPGDWLTALQDALDQLRPYGKPAAVGVTGQMSGLLLLDDAGRPLYPFLPWSDRRAEEGAGALAGIFGAERLYRTTGCRPAGSYPAAKLWWFRQHHPGIWQRARYVVGAREYLVMLLTGAQVTDPSGAGATQLYDIVEGRWWTDMLAALQLHAELPAVKAPWDVAGFVGHGSTTLGLPTGIPVVVGAGDGACASWGAGVSEPGDAVMSIGTSGVIRIFSGSPVFHPRAATTCYPVGGGLYAGTGVTSAAGAALAWAAQALGCSDLSSLEETAIAAPPGAEGVVFVPHLSGAKTPTWNPAARAKFHGLELRHTRAHLARAVFEGVSLALARALESLREAGASPVRLLITGGGTRSTLLCQTIAGLTRLPAFVVRQGDAVLGAAQLAAAGIGMDEGLDVIRRRMMSVREPVSPLVLPENMLENYLKVAELV